MPSPAAATGPSDIVAVAYHEDVSARRAWLCSRRGCSREAKYAREGRGNSTRGRPWARNTRSLAVLSVCSKRCASFPSWFQKCRTARIVRHWAQGGDRARSPRAGKHTNKGCRAHGVYVGVIQAAAPRGRRRRVVPPLCFRGGGCDGILRFFPDPAENTTRAPRYPVGELIDR